MWLVSISASGAHEKIRLRKVQMEERKTKKMEAVITLSDEDIDRIASAVAAKLDRPKSSTYTIPDLMDKLQMSRDTITDRIRKGQFGDVLRDGWRYRVTETGLQTYIQQHCGTIYPKSEKQAVIRMYVNPGKI